VKNNAKRWNANMSGEWISIACWVFVTVAILAVVFCRPMPKPFPVPDDAVTIGPGYMRVWATERQIHVKFRNGVTVLFDRKAANEFGEWLANVNEAASK
jgi:hypothetical protein